MIDEHFSLLTRFALAIGLAVLLPKAMERAGPCSVT